MVSKQRHVYLELWRDGFFAGSQSCDPAALQVYQLQVITPALPTTKALISYHVWEGNDLDYGYFIDPFGEIQENYINKEFEFIILSIHVFSKVL
jgi:hypothetical protein